MKNKFFLGKRSCFSDTEAILRISKYGLAKIIKIEQDKVIEEFIEFDNKPLDIKQLAYLAKNIHQNKKDLKSLVHGDLGAYNTTLYKNVPKCYDYEHAHFGNNYSDLGRIILRSCKDVTEVANFFNEYGTGTPNPLELKEGLIYFCNWQHKIRCEKGLSYQQVPLIRKQRLEGASEDLVEILKAFKDEVNLI